MGARVPRFRELVDTKRVLLVDDDPLILRALRTRLTYVGHDVQAYSDGASALCGLEAWPADVAVLDINMRGLDGFQVSKAIRERYPDCRIVMQTASKSDEIWSKLSHQDVDAVLEKPFDSKVLLALIENMEEPDKVDG